MQVFVRLLGIGVWLFCLALQTNAQHSVIDRATQDYLNLYIDYTNANIHGIRLYQRKFEQVNQLMNQYYSKAPFDRAARLAFEGKNNLVVKFEKPTVMTDPTVFEVLPEVMYQQIMATPTRIPSAQLLVLQQRIKEIHDIATEVTNLGQNFEDYCLNGSYLDDTTLAVGYRMLNRAEILLHDFSESKDLLLYELKKVNNSFLQPNLNNPYIRSANKLLTFAQYARNVLVSLKKEDKNTVANQLPLMETAWRDLVENQAKYLEGVTSQASVDAYNMTARKAEVFIKITREFLENPFTDPKYAAYGLEYYNYNQNFLNNYNRYGAGLIADYNKFVQVADVPILKMTEEVHWLKILPQPYRPDRPISPPPAKSNLINIDNQPDFTAPPVKKDSAKTYPEPVVENPAPKVEVVQEAAAIAGSAPVNFVFLMDVSGSMQKPYKLPLLKNSFKNLIELLRPTDLVSIVVYSGNSKVALPATPIAEKGKILQAINDLKSSGESDIEKGTKLAYKTVAQHFLPDGNNRVILATDGGIEFKPELYDLIKGQSLDKNVFLSVFYYEDQEYAAKAAKLKELAKNGRGNYAYINAKNSDEALIKEVNSVRRK